MAATIKDLGKVTAYSYAKAAGYTGTEAEFQQVFDEFTQNAPGLINRMDTAVARAEAAVTNIDATIQDAVDDAVEEATASAVATANQAVSDAQAAQAAAEGAVTQANAAVTQANNAVTAAQTAQSAAEDAAESFVIDNTLAVSGAAADAKKTGDEILYIKNATSELETKSVYFYREMNTDEPSCFCYFDGSGDIGIRPKLVHRLKVRIIHPSGKTSSSTNGVGYLIAVHTVTGTNKNIIVDGNSFPQDHTQPHKMELAFDLIALDYKVVGTVDYYCDDNFVMRKDINVDESNGVSYLYAIGGYFNTGRGEIVFQAVGQLETTKTNQLSAT